MKKIIFTLVIILATAYFSRSYDNIKAHRDFNSEIVVRFKSAIQNWAEFKNYNFGFDLIKVTGPAVTASGKTDATTEDRAYHLAEWITEGGYSADEPEAPAAYRHFYDPLSNDGKSYLSDINSIGAQFNPNVDAIFWHFMGNDLNGNNDWSWHKGKDYMTKAIAEGDEKIRNQYLAKAFRSLGEVLHNTADMGCPPHVRNDAHGGFGLGGSDPYEGGFQSTWINSYKTNKCDPGLANLFKSSPNAMEINKQLAIFTNKYFFSDETISGIGVKEYSSRNGKKNYPAPKLNGLEYIDETFNFCYNFASGRKVEMCNDQSVLLGFLTQDFRSYPRVTLKNTESQASELVPAIIEAGSYVMRHFIPVLVLSMEINNKDKKIDGTVKSTPTTEYPNSLHYNGKVSFMVDGKISATTASASNGAFTVTETDKKFPGAKKIVAYIELAGIMIKTDEFSMDGLPKYSVFTFGMEMPSIQTMTNKATKQITIYPAGRPVQQFEGAISLSGTQYTGSWNTTNTNSISQGTIKITFSGGQQTATVEVTDITTFSQGVTHTTKVICNEIPADKMVGSYYSKEPFKYFSLYSFVVDSKDYSSEYKAVEKDEKGESGYVILSLGNNQ